MPGAQDLEQTSGIPATAQGLYMATLFYPKRSLVSTKYSDKRAACWTSEVSKQAGWQKDPADPDPPWLSHPQQCESSRRPTHGIAGQQEASRPSQHLEILPPGLVNHQAHPGHLQQQTCVRAAPRASTPSETGAGQGCRNERPGSRELPQKLDKAPESPHSGKNPNSSLGPKRVPEPP